MIHHINKFKDKNHKSYDNLNRCRRSLQKNSELIYDKKKKTLQKMGTEGTYVNITKAIYDKHTANIILKDEKLKVFPLRSGIRQGCPH